MLIAGWHRWRLHCYSSMWHMPHKDVLHPLQVPGLESQGLLLDVQKLLLTAAAATQNADTICTVSRCLQSAAQELRCLQVRRVWNMGVGQELENGNALVATAMWHTRTCIHKP